MLGRHTECIPVSLKPMHPGSTLPSIFKMDADNSCPSRPTSAAPTTLQRAQRYIGDGPAPAHLAAHPMPSSGCHPGWPTCWIPSLLSAAHQHVYEPQRSVYEPSGVSYLSSGARQVVWSAGLCPTRFSRGSGPRSFVNVFRPPCNPAECYCRPSCNRQLQEEK